MSKYIEKCLPLCKCASACEIAHNTLTRIWWWRFMCAFIREQLQETMNKMCPWYGEWRTHQPSKKWYAFCGEKIPNTNGSVIWSLTSARLCTHTHTHQQSENGSIRASKWSHNEKERSSSTVYSTATHILFTSWLRNMRTAYKMNTHKRFFYLAMAIFLHGGCRCGCFALVKRAHKPIL